ncbi:MAG: sensor histidine kinase [Phenylobacterium sp.]
MIIRDGTAAASPAPTFEKFATLSAVQRECRSLAANSPRWPATRGACGFSIDRGWRITAVTPAARAWFDVDDLNMIGADVRGQMMLPRQLKRALAACIDAAGPAVISCRSQRHPGRWVEYHVVPTATGACVRFRLGGTARRTAAIEEDGEPVAGPRQGAGSGIVEIALFGEDGLIVSQNAAWRAALARLSPQEPAGAASRSYFEVLRGLLADFDEPAFRRDLRDLVDHPSNTIVRTYEVVADGAGKLRQLQITHLPGRKGVSFVATHEDLTGLASAQAKLRSTVEQLLLAQEAERQRIAVELHDSTSQHLAALNFGVARLHRLVDQVPGVQTLLDEMGVSLQEAMKEIRILSYLMKTPNLANDGLANTAARFVKGFGARTALAATFHSKGAIEDSSAEAQHAAFRVIQEALSNVHRHACAEQVSVTVTRQEDTLRVQIADDGRGIPELQRGEPGAIALGVGLEGMRTRVEQLRGVFQISCDGPGTRVDVTIPVGGGADREQPAAPSGLNCATG